MNKTDERVSLVNVGASPPSVYATVEPQGRIRFDVVAGSDGCTPDANLTAFAEDGRELGHIGKSCRGDTWILDERDGD